jgi:hypothetical protein
MREDGGDENDIRDGGDYAQGEGGRKERQRVRD